MAPRLIRFADTLNSRIRMKPNNMDRGITDATIIPARTFPKKTIRTRKTIIAPSIKLNTTVEILRLTKLDLFRYGWIDTPSGNIFCNFSTRLSSSRVTTLAFAPFSIMAIPPTHSPFPSFVIAPNRLGAPSRTRPTSLICTGIPFRFVITTCSISDGRVIIPSARI